MFCTQCSRQLADTSKFCSYCGSALNSGIPHIEQTPDIHKKVQTGTQSSSGVNIKKLSIVVIIFSSLICSFLIIRSFVETVNTDTLIDYALVDVEGGTFIMGSPPNEEQRDDDECQHQVTVNSFRIGKYEVTQKQWKSVMGSNPSEFKGCDDCPVENVSWDDVQQFISKLNEKSSIKYRLPTVEEWEFAARGGTQSRGYVYSGGNTLNSVAWYSENSGNKSHRVGVKSPNELGLFDMSGNVWEWCQDWYKPYPGCGGSDDTASRRVLRGGSWGGDPQLCRVAFRDYFAPDIRVNYLGFRLAMTK